MRDCLLVDMLGRIRKCGGMGYGLLCGGSCDECSKRNGPARWKQVKDFGK